MFRFVRIGLLLGVSTIAQWLRYCPLTQEQQLIDNVKSVQQKASILMTDSQIAVFM